MGSFVVPGAFHPAVTLFAVDQPAEEIWSLNCHDRGMINVSRHIVTDRSWQDLVSLAGFNREGVESGEILADEGDVLHALLYSQLFWPSFIEESSAIFFSA